MLGQGIVQYAFRVMTAVAPVLAVITSPIRPAKSAGVSNRPLAEPQLVRQVDQLFSARVVAIRRFASSGPSQGPSLRERRRVELDDPSGLSSL